MGINTNNTEGNPEAPGFGGSFTSKNIGKGIEHVRNPVNAVMQNINIRTLVNGRTQTVKESAIEDLFANGISPEVIETELSRLGRTAPKIFPQNKVDEAIKFVWDFFNNRI